MGKNSGNCGYGGKNMTIGTGNPNSRSIGKAPPAGAHGFGHAVPQRKGAVRASGHPSAHRLGGRKK